MGSGRSFPHRVGDISIARLGSQTWCFDGLIWVIVGFSVDKMAVKRASVVLSQGRSGASLGEFFVFVYFLAKSTTI